MTSEGTVGENKYDSDSEVLTTLVATFERANPESRDRLFQTLGTYLGLPVSSKTSGSVPSTREKVAAVADFTEDRSRSAKEFMMEKRPQTDVERVACLAYYLAHYLNQPQFKTVDISRLNTEAAQIKFSNPALAVENATKYRYLTHAGKGFKQISTFGEQYVTALPDRDAAKAVMTSQRKRRANKRRIAPK